MKSIRTTAALLVLGLCAGAGASASSNDTLGVEVSYHLSPQWKARFLVMFASVGRRF